MHGGYLHDGNIELDMSININPIGMPESARNALMESAAKTGIYPDIECRKLLSAIADYHGVPADTVICSNGASELLQIAAYMLRPKIALILAPSFSGYERALSNAGADVIYSELSPESDFAVGREFVSKILGVSPELVIISNPNNPNGMTIKKDIGEEIVKACRDVGAHLIIDECFVELTDEGEDSSFKYLLKESKGVVIIRAFTKSYGMPGVRLAYGLCSDRDLASWIKSYLPEWNVSVMAQEAGTAAILSDNRAYFAESLNIITTERNYLATSLKELGMTVFPSKTNFIMFKDMHGRDIFSRLKEKGILIRDCSDYEGLGKGYYRICVSTHDNNEEFIKALKEVL